MTYMEFWQKSRHWVNLQVHQPQMLILSQDLGALRLGLRVANTKWLCLEKLFERSSQYHEVFLSAISI
jgi:hypothetical protein